MADIFNSADEALLSVLRGGRAASVLIISKDLDDSISLVSGPEMTVESANWLLTLAQSLLVSKTMVPKFFPVVVSTETLKQE